MGICNVSLVETFLLKSGYINLCKVWTRLVDIGRSPVQVNLSVTGEKFRNFLYPRPSLLSEFYPLLSVAMTCESRPLFLSDQNKSDTGF